MGQEKQIVFLGGHRKCGTSMFASLFDNHSQAFLYPWDLKLLYAYYPQYLGTDFSEDEKINRLDLVLFESVQQSLPDNILQTYPLAKIRGNFFDALDAQKLDDIQYLIHRLLTIEAQALGKENCSVQIMKETSSEIYAPDLFNWFPGLKFVHLLRDPRDNYASLKSGVTKHYSKLGEGDKETLASLLNRYSTGLKAGLAAQEAHGESHYLFVKFEDLTQDLESQIHKVCAFLSLDFEETLLQPTLLGKPNKGNNMDGETFKNVDSRNVNRWKERITDEEAMIIEFHLGDLMEKFGYKREYRLTDVAHAAQEFYKWQNYRYFFNDPFEAIKTKDYTPRIVNE